MLKNNSQQFWILMIELEFNSKLVSNWLHSFGKRKINVLIYIELNGLFEETLLFQLFHRKYFIYVG